jgi:hypothetical protein
VSLKIPAFYVVFDKKTRLPTWDKMKLRGLEGSGWCPLCKGVEETNFHLSLACPFSQHTWLECSTSLQRYCKWQGQTIEEAWKQWLQDPKNNNIKSLPLLINWGVWLSRNSSIFKEKSSIPELIAAQSLSILSHFPQGKDGSTIRQVTKESVDHSRSWAFLMEPHKMKVCCVEVEQFYTYQNLIFSK